jgi:hypothetical protein
VAQVGVLVAERGDQGDALAVGEGEGPGVGRDDRPLLACSSGESAGLFWQLYSHGSVKNDMFTTSMPALPA